MARSTTTRKLSDFPIYGPYVGPTMISTVKELELFWHLSRDEWGLLGPTRLEDSEQIRFVRNVGGGWTLERESDGIWYAASDEIFRDEDVPLEEK